MILNDMRFNKGLPVRILTDAHRSSTSVAVSKFLAERNARMQFVLSGCTQYTQFMDIRGGAAQALKNGGKKSTTSVLRQYYDKSQESKYQRTYQVNGAMCPMKIPDVIKMVEVSLKHNVTPDVVKRAWDAVATDLLPDLATLKVLTTDLKRAFLHTPPKKMTKDAVAKKWLEREKIRKDIRDARKITWVCPGCSFAVENATYRITNGEHKGFTKAQKHRSICLEFGGESKSELEEVSSTEERVKEGERVKELRDKRRVRVCPYKGCKKKYKGKSGAGFRNHLKTCTFKTQKELGEWVIRNSRKYDHDMLDT